VKLMRKKTKVPPWAAPLTKDDYTARYTVYTKTYYDWHYETSESTLEEAIKTAKKYIHINDVKIEEKLTRTVKTLPQVPVCT
jgi:hypothetical protein